MELSKNEMSKLIMELFANPELKQRIMREPVNVLKEMDIDAPEDTEIKVVEDTKTVKHIILPYLEPDEKLTPEELEARLSKTFIIT